MNENHFRFYSILFYSSLLFMFFVWVCFLFSLLFFFHQFPRYGFDLLVELVGPNVRIACCIVLLLRSNDYAMATLIVLRIVILLLDNDDAILLFICNIELYRLTVTSVCSLFTLQLHWSAFFVVGVLFFFCASSLQW